MARDLSGSSSFNLLPEKSCPFFVYRDIGNFRFHNKEHIPTTRILHLFLCFLFNLVFPTGSWACRWVLTGLGYGLGIKGAPKCPQIVTQAARILAWLRDGAWGPSGENRPTEHLWKKLLQWADADPDVCCPSCVTVDIWWTSTSARNTSLPNLAQPETPL